MMKYCILLLLFSQWGNKSSWNMPGTSHLHVDTNHPVIYVLKFYYKEDPATVRFTRAYARADDKKGAVCIIDYDPVNRNKVTYTSCYDAEGVPTRFGSEGEFTMVYKDSLRLNFMRKDTTIRNFTSEELKDPTVLWFWKRWPKVNETVKVGGVRKNFVTKKIDRLQVAHTYLGKDNIIVLGKMQTCYKVKSIPLNGSTGIYDERWFDRKGMLVKEYHVVGKDGVRVCELTEIVRQ